MTASVLLLADAIASQINIDEAADVFAPFSFTANRSYPDWDDDFKDLDTLSVDVVFVSSYDSGLLIELQTEESEESAQAIDIAVRYRFAVSERDGRLKQTAIDPLVGLVEKLHERLAATRADALVLDANTSAHWIDSSVRTYCDYKRLREGVFLGVVRMRYMVSKVV